MNHRIIYPNSICYTFIGLLAVGFMAMGAVAGLPFLNATEASAALRPDSFANLADRSSPAVVNIRTVKTVKGGGQVFRQFRQRPFGKNDPFHDFFDRFFGDERQRQFKQRSLGSGFIIDQDGYIVTNNHVIENADEIRVKLKNDKEFDAEIIGRDKNTDIALIKIKATGDLPVLELGDSNALKVGEWVMAIGNPFGLGHTVTAGIVSAKGRVIGSGPYDDFIQTDASINPGNSGGPLINLSGKVIGINTAIIASGQGIGFAIPVNMAVGIIDQLKNQGEVTRGWLGVGIQDVNKDMAEYYGLKEGEGVLVVQVFPGDPADLAGIKARDIILEVNGRKVKDSRGLSRMIADIGVGDQADVKLMRDGKERTINVKISKRDDKQLAAAPPQKAYEEELGIKVSALTPEIATQFKMSESDGVIVVEVAPDSKGAGAGVQVGDIIKEVNHTTVDSVEAFRSAVDRVKKGDSVQMFILRRGRGFLVIKLIK